jgi:hypothetical protein
MKPKTIALLTKNATPGGEGSSALPTAFVGGTCRVVQNFAS